MKGCRFFVLFVAILLLIEGYDAGLPRNKLSINKKTKNIRAKGAGQRTMDQYFTTTPATRNPNAPVPGSSGGPSQEEEEPPNVLINNPDTGDIVDSIDFSKCYIDSKPGFPAPGTICKVRFGKDGSTYFETAPNNLLPEENQNFGGANRPGDARPGMDQKPPSRIPVPYSKGATGYNVPRQPGTNKGATGYNVPRQPGTTKGAMGYNAPGQPGTNKGATGQPGTSKGATGYNLPGPPGTTKGATGNNLPEQPGTTKGATGYNLPEQPGTSKGAPEFKLPKQPGTSKGNRQSAEGSFERPETPTTPVSRRPSSSADSSPSCILPRRKSSISSDSDSSFTENTITTPSGRTTLQISVVTSSSTCEGGEMYDVGYRTDNKKLKKKGPFIKVYQVCHDPVRLHTIYAHITISPELEPFKRPDRKFGQAHSDLGQIPGKDVEKAYMKQTQILTLKEILGSENIAQRLIKNDKQSAFYLARGHLIASADVKDKYEVYPTFTFINAVPMWQTINNGCWKSMELSVRKLSNDRKINLKTWVGSIGTMTIKNEAGEPKEFYLLVQGETRKVPVPELLYKVIVTEYEGRKAGVVFLTLNDPYATELGARKICPDICNQISYLKWKPTNATQGLSYCCEIDEFVKHPGVKINGLDRGVEILK